MSGGGMQRPGTYIANTSKKMLARRIPDSMKWNRVKESVNCRRVEMKIKPEQTTYANNSNPIIRFMLPNIDFLDFRQAYLRFTLTITPAGGATYTRLSQGIWSMFDQIRITTGSMELEKVLYLNLITSFIHEMIADPFIVATTDRVLHGVGTQTDRNTWGATTAKSYCLPISSGFLNSGLMPMGFMKDTMYVEWYICNPALCCETDGTGTAPVLTVNFPELVCMRCTPSNDYMNMVKRKIGRGGIGFGFKSWLVYQNTPTPSATFSFQISHRTSSVDSIVNIMRNSVDLNNMLINDRLVTYRYNNISTYQLRWNGIIIPDEPVYCGNGGIQPYIILLKWLGCWQSTGVYHDTPNINELHWTTTVPNGVGDRFCFINDLTTMATSGLFSPVSSSEIASTIQADIVLTSVPAQAIQIDSMVCYFNLCILGRSYQFLKVY
jgi:hypothetical protein